MGSTRLLGLWDFGSPPKQRDNVVVDSTADRKLE